MRSFLKTALFLMVMNLSAVVLADPVHHLANDPADMTGKDLIDRIEIRAHLEPVALAPTFTGFIEAHLQLDGTDRPVPIVDMGFQRNFSKYGLGFAGFLLVQDGWAQAYVGPTYMPADWVQLGVSLGGEMGSDYKLKARYATSLWLGYDIFSFTGCVEFNNDSFRGDRSGVWYDFLLKLTPQSWVSVGLRERRFVGLGPYLEFVAPIPEAPLTIWAAYTPFEPEEVDGYWHAERALVGAAFNF